jgi:hypothetical protein
MMEQHFRIADIDPVQRLDVGEIHATRNALRQLIDYGARHDHAFVELSEQVKLADWCRYSGPRRRRQRQVFAKSSSSSALERANVSTPKSAILARKTGFGTLRAIGKGFTSRVRG